MTTTRHRIQEADLHFENNLKENVATVEKIGHKSADCWECPENKETHPKNYRVSNMSDDKKRNYDEKCRYCHKPGHKENVCFKKQCNVAHHAEEESEDVCTHHRSEQTKNSAG